MPYKSAEAQREYQRRWLAARRAEWIAEHGPCMECGTDENLDVDHIDPATKLFEISTLWSLSKNNPKRVAELAKCQVLCESCHQEKTNKENSYDVLVHGTRHCYMKFKCRCTPCTQAASEYRQQNRAASLA